MRGFAVKFYTEEGNWDLVGNNTPVFYETLLQAGAVPRVIASASGRAPASTAPSCRSTR